MTSEKRYLPILLGLLLAGGACSSSGGKAVSFTSCEKAKAAGYSSMKKGEPGYSAKLDADGDGVACDKP